MAVKYKTRNIAGTLNRSTGRPYVEAVLVGCTNSLAKYDRDVMAGKIKPFTSIRFKFANGLELEGEPIKLRATGRPVRYLE